MKIIYLILFLSVCQANEDDFTCKDPESKGAQAFCFYFVKKLKDKNAPLAMSACKCLSGVFHQQKSLCTTLDKNRFGSAPSCNKLLKSAAYTKFTKSETVKATVKYLLKNFLDVCSNDNDDLQELIESLFQSEDISSLLEQQTWDEKPPEGEIVLVGNCYKEMRKLINPPAPE